MHEYIINKGTKLIYEIDGAGGIYITMPEEAECIVRCCDCKKRLPKGWKFDKYCNEAEQDACNLFSNHDFDYDYTHFFYVEPGNFCAWGEHK